MTLSRRQLFTATGGAAVAVAAGGGLTACSDELARTSTTAGRAATSVVYPFRGLRHQAGITAPASAAGLVMGLDVRVEDRAELVTTLASLSASIEQVMSGEAYEVRDGGFPPLDTGIVEPGPTGTSVIVGVGDSLFDDRFGLADRRPIELQPMPKFANDSLVRPERSHGDLSIVVNADSSEAAVHALRQILRAHRGTLVPRWMREGFNQLRPDAGPGRAAGRNLLGFLDGTANPDLTDDALTDAFLWVQDGDGQPDWAVGGTYQAIRVIRMMVEFWDRTRLNEQEAIFFRHRNSGAPLGKELESDEPDFGGSFDSHIARANPRTPGSARNLMLRRGFNYAGGLDDNDQLDQGLLFTSYQRSLIDGFITVQRRLDGEALEEYIRPLGGGFFFVPPAPQGDEHLFARLLA